MKISAILTIFVLFGGGVTSSFQSVMAQTADNSTTGPSNLNKGALNPVFAQHMKERFANFHGNMTQLMKERFANFHGNMTQLMKERFANFHGNMTGKMHGMLTNRTALMKESKAFGSDVKNITKSYNDAIKQAYKQANISLKQAEGNMTASIKQIQEAVLQAKKSSGNTTSTQSNATHNTNSKYDKANTAYKEALKQVDQEYKTAVANAIKDAKSNETQIQQGLKSGNNTKHSLVSISSRANADKSYFDIKANEVKAIADAAFTHRENTIQAMITGFASVTGDNPTLDNALQTYASTVNNVMQTFNGAVDTANSAAQSAIDAASTSP